MVTRLVILQKMNLPACDAFISYVPGLAIEFTPPFFVLLPKGRCLRLLMTIHCYNGPHLTNILLVPLPTISPLSILF